MKLNELEDFPELGNTIVIDGIEYVKKREPLSEAAVGELLMGGFSTHLMDLVRMVEKAHGIGVDDER